MGPARKCDRLLDQKVARQGGILGDLHWCCLTYVKVPVAADEQRFALGWRLTNGYQRYYDCVGAEVNVVMELEQRDVVLHDVLYDGEGFTDHLPKLCTHTDRGGLKVYFTAEVTAEIKRPVKGIL